TGQKGVEVRNVPAGAPANVQFNTVTEKKPAQGAQGPQGPAAGPTAGIFIVNSPGTQVVGNVLTGAGGDSVGIELVGPATTDTLLQGNFVAGFGGAGVLITNFASNNTVNAGNTVHDNGGDGVRVESGTGNAILSNAIFANAGLGINLVGGSEDAFGVTAN